MTTQTFHAQWAWRGGEEAIANVRIGVSNGVISSVEDGVDAQASDVRIAGVVMPGLVNAHSHAFHRALRGRTHGGSGDFWSWRTPMYEIANRLTPETYGELAAMTFAEMALSGITGVGEFHYIHHQPDGKRYTNPNEMGLAMVAASQRAGIRMALLDVAYLHAGLDKPEPLAEQKRFSDGTIDNWLDRVDALGEGDINGARGAGWTVGMAPHSVRAVHPSELEEVVANRHGKVVHVHVSEQPAENAACIAATGKTPTQVLADAGLLGGHFTAVHATHLAATDISLLGSSHSGVCMCPTTERDLADGVGPASSLSAGGAVLSLGTDSNAFIDMFEEARAVETDERLVTGKRGAHTPASLLIAATTGGATALGWGQYGIHVGAPADFIALSLDSVRLASFDGAHGAAHIVHAASPADVRDVWVGGHQIVQDHHHRNVSDVVGGLGRAIAAVVTL
ncbi:MAG: formimidoylglutamate deiminase [Actinobacteria bacterium]|nr:MAG: formimidoylglutamate deiminase [Actinomycetota bacterium]